MTGANDEGHIIIEQQCLHGGSRQDDREGSNCSRPS